MSLNHTDATSQAIDLLDAATAFRAILREERENPSAQAHTINALRDDATHAVRMAGVYAQLAQAAATRELIAELGDLSGDLSGDRVHLLSGEVVG